MIINFFCFWLPGASWDLLAYTKLIKLLLRSALHRQFFEESHHTIVLSISEALIPTDQPGLNQPASQYVASLSTANLVTRSAAAASLTRALVYRGQLCLLCSAAVC